MLSVCRLPVLRMTILRLTIIRLPVARRHRLWVTRHRWLTRVLLRLSGILVRMARVLLGSVLLLRVRLLRPVLAGPLLPLRHSWQWHPLWRHWHSRRITGRWLHRLWCGSLLIRHPSRAGPCWQRREAWLSQFERDFIRVTLATLFDLLKLFVEFAHVGQIVVWFVIRRRGSLQRRLCQHERMFALRTLPFASEQTAIGELQ